jgi:hypothetical protein
MAKRLGLVALVVCLALLGMKFRPAPARAADSVVTEIRIDDEGVRVGDTEYERDEGVSDRTRVRVTGENIVKFADDIVVDKDEVIEGDVVAILGNVIVDGRVEGDVVSVGGEVKIGSTGEVEGDAVSVGGGVEKEEGARVHGETVSVGPGRGFRPEVPAFSHGVFSRGGRLAIFILWTIMVIILGLIIMAVFRRGVENVCERARKEAFKMGLIGLLAEVLLLPLMLLFIVTIIGIPIGIFVLPLVFALAVLFGYVGVSYAVGSRLGNGHGRSPYLSMTIGVIVLAGLAILGGLIGLPGGSVHIIGRLVGFIGWAVIFVAATVGLGAVIMSRFGTRGLEPKPAVQTWQAQAPQGPPPSGMASGPGQQAPPPGT